MVFKFLSCLILFSKQTLPLLGNVLPPVIVNNNKGFINDPDSLSMYAKYEEWNPRVINGWEAKLGDVPYQAALKSIEKRPQYLYSTFCGAVIIGPRKLLTAAHCFEEESLINCNKKLYPGKVSSFSLWPLYVVAGTLKNIAEYNTDGQWRKLEKVRFPVTYDFPNDDIAVVVIKRKFNFNNHVSPIPMASKHVNYRGRCLTSGYGRIGSHEDSDLSSHLLLAHLTLMSEKRCRRLIGKQSEKFICTSVRFANVGKGDSGGPLVCAKTGDPKELDNGVLVGIISGTAINSHTSFTRVSSYRSFIDSVNSVSFPMNKYNMQSCTTITLALIYKTFVLL